MNLKVYELAVLVDGVTETRVIAMEGERFVGTVAVLHQKVFPAAGGFHAFQREMCAGIRQLFVESTMRGNGIGGVLLTRACKIASETGCVAINASLAKENLEVLGFYQLYGFFPAHKYDDGSLMLVRQLRGGA